MEMMAGKGGGGYHGDAAQGWVSGVDVRVLTWLPPPQRTKIYGQCLGTPPPDFERPPLNNTSLKPSLTATFDGLRRTILRAVKRQYLMTSKAIGPLIWPFASCGDRAQSVLLTGKSQAYKPPGLGTMKGIVPHLALVTIVWGLRPDGVAHPGSAEACLRLWYGVFSKCTCLRKQIHANTST